MFRKLARCALHNGFRMTTSPAAFLPAVPYRSFVNYRQNYKRGTPVDVPAVTESMYMEDPQDWFSTATRESALGRHRGLKGSPRKVNDLCRMIRGLSVHEALAQLKFSSCQKSIFVANCLNNAVNNGVNNFHMNRKRLIVHSAHATKGQYQKEAHFRARGRTDLRLKYFCHVTVSVAEQPYTVGEERLGKYPSRTHQSLRHVLDKLKEHRQKPTSETTVQTV